jgi:RND superfamily putative drug exporter
MRVLLVPAVMRLLGPVNWWAPGPLRRLYARHGIREDAQNVAPAPDTHEAGATVAG